MWPLLIALAALGAGPESLPGPPRGVSREALIAIGEDGRDAVAVGRDLLVWDLTTGKKRISAKLPAEKWQSVALAPHTDGEVERALLVATRRLMIVHLRTGRAIAEWRVTTDAQRYAFWSPDGRKVGLVGWDIPALRTTPRGRDEVPVLIIDAEVGSVISELRLPVAATLTGATFLRDSRTIVVGVGARLVVLGPGPNDARTIAIDHERVIGATRDAIVVQRRGTFVLVDPASGARASNQGIVRAPVELTGEARMLPGGRWVYVAGSDAVFACDLGRREVTVLDATALAGDAFPTTDGFVVVGKKVARVDSTGGLPDAWKARRLCSRGTCQSGDGAMVDLVDNRVYSGDFKRGEPDGQGMLRYEDGSVYVGAFARGKPHGPGRLITPSGSERQVRAVEGRWATP